MLKLKQYNVNPKGKKASDCVIRAIAYASGLSWEEVFEGLTRIALKEKCIPNEKKVYETYLEELGFVKHSQPKKYDGTKYMVYEADIVVDTNKFDVVVSVANHLTCLDGNDIIDTWNCGSKCIGNYWTRLKRENTVRPENHSKTRKTKSKECIEVDGKTYIRIF